MTRYSVKPIILLVVLATVLIVTHITNISPLPNVEIRSQHRPHYVHRRPFPTSASLEELPEPQQTQISRCRTLPGAEDVLVVMRTGSTEIKDKLPIHFNTTFKCYPDTLLFSDYAETFEGYEIHDALARIPEHIKQTNEDFELYRRLREHGRGILNDSELSGPESPDSGQIGKLENKGWKLDKWKFLPMMADVLEMRPDKKFYVFVEPDTYLMWSNLLQWLRTVNPDEDRYFGSETMIGEDLFGHGGSAFLMTNSALRKGVESYTSRTDHWNEVTNWHWAGDCMVGKALSEVGVPLTFTWPMFQGGNPAHLTWNEAKGPNKLWCSPVFTYHHLTSREVEGLWKFEQRWISGQHARTGEDGVVAHIPRPQSVLAESPFSRDSIIRHRNVFEDHLLKNLKARQRNWRNNADSLLESTEGISMSDCRLLCQYDETCVQFSVDPRGCFLGTRFEGGQPEENVQSGWLMDRVDAWTNAFTCEDRNLDWVTR